MSPFLSTTMRRFSRSSSIRNTSNPTSPPNSFANTNGGVNPTTASSVHSNSNAVTNSSSAASSTHKGQQGLHSHSLSHTGVSATSGPMGLQSNGIANDSRPISSATEQSFDFANRPVTSHQLLPSLPSQLATSGTMGGIGPLSPTGGLGGAGVGHSAIGNLTRTDQIVLKHFWEFKYNENCKRDLHYLKFPFFPQFPSHKDLLPYCEIYHLVKTSPGATIISLGSTNGVYIGFELQTGSQLHIDMDDEWHNISHHRVHFKSYENMIRDPASDVIFKTWPKPLTIEFLEEQYQKWCLDLMSLCWEGKEVRELGGGSASGASGHTNGGHGGPQSPIGGEVKRGF